MLKILAPWSWFQHKKNNWYFFLKGGYFYWEFDIKYLENFHESQSTFVFSDVLINYILTFQPQAYSFFYVSFVFSFGDRVSLYIIAWSGTCCKDQPYLNS